MSCGLTTGFVLDCRDSIGGIKAVWIIETANVSGVTSSAGVITAISKANNARFWKYLLTRGVGEATEEIQANEENGTLFWNQTVTIAINKLQAATRNEIILLAQNYLSMVVQDRNDKYWYYGKDTGLILSAGSAKTGKAQADRNGYELTFTGGEEDLALEVTSGIISGLTTP